MASRSLCSLYSKIYLHKSRIFDVLVHFRINSFRKAQFLNNFDPIIDRKLNNWYGGALDYLQIRNPWKICKVVLKIGKERRNRLQRIPIIPQILPQHTLINRDINITVLNRQTNTAAAV